jgi:imidazoleglycerol phosphate dehydratase HisB
LLRTVAEHRMTDHKRDEDVGVELGITDDWLYSHKETIKRHGKAIWKNVWKPNT